MVARAIAVRVAIANSKRSEAAMAETEKMGMKIAQPLRAMGVCDVVVLLEAPHDETRSAFSASSAHLLSRAK